MAVEKFVAAGSGESHLCRFRRVVLGWDYLRLLEESTRKDGEALGLKKVQKNYRDMEEYLGVFEPLLFEEVKAQIVQVKDEEVSKWEKAAVVTCDEVNDFHVATVVVDETFPNVSENDLFLLSREEFSEGTVPNAYAFAVVESRGNQTVKLRTFLSGEIKQIDKFDVTSSQRLSNMLTILKKKESIFSILKICSLSTIMREYAALHSLGTLPFKKLILSAADRVENGNFEDRAWNVSRPLMDFLQNDHNESQLDAIRAGLMRKPFVLIQGPPGTGKTQTILGLLSAVLHSVPERVQSVNGVHSLKSRPELPLHNKYCHWTKASPWLTGANPRDLIMPKDGYGGFFPTSGNELKPEVVSSNRKYRVHVLVCAPSNSALDEIVLRVLRTGIHDENDRVYNPKIVRIGLKPHHSVQAVSMDYLVEQKLASMDRMSGVGKDATSGPMDRDRIRSSIIDEAAIVFSTLSFSGSTMFSRMNRAFDVVIIDEAAQACFNFHLYCCCRVLIIAVPRDLGCSPTSRCRSTLPRGSGYCWRTAELLFFDFSSPIVASSRLRPLLACYKAFVLRLLVVDPYFLAARTSCAVMSCCVVGCFRRNTFARLATPRKEEDDPKSVEPATLVPLAHGCKQVFLVGDPVQLPATVISPTAEKLGYGTSLFKRFQEAGYPVQMLKTQYRMHPKIRTFPSKEFYSDSLEDGELVPKQTKRPWHDYRCFGPFCFFDIDGVESQPSGSGSWINEDEVEFILVMYHNLASRYPELKSSSQLAVISPYRHQVKLLRDNFNITFGERSELVVDINTVDGFQGREKDVAIFSCVRANIGKGIGFVSDYRRMNVGITRARSSVLVVGSASTLMQNDHWKNLIDCARTEDCYFKISKPYASFFSETNLKPLERIDSREGMAARMAEHMATMENTVMETAPVSGDQDADMDGDAGGGYDE